MHYSLGFYECIIYSLFLGGVCIETRIWILYVFHKLCEMSWVVWMHPFMWISLSTKVFIAFLLALYGLCENAYVFYGVCWCCGMLQPTNSTISLQYDESICFRLCVFFPRPKPMHPEQKCSSLSTEFLFKTNNYWGKKHIFHVKRNFSALNVI